MPQRRRLGGFREVQGVEEFELFVLDFRGSGEGSGADMGGVFLDADQQIQRGARAREMALGFQAHAHDAIAHKGEETDQGVGPDAIGQAMVRDVLDGRQPLGFTSDWCKTHVLPSDWTAQRLMVAAL